MVNDTPASDFQPANLKVKNATDQPDDEAIRDLIDLEDLCGRPEWPAGLTRNSAVVLLHARRIDKSSGTNSVGRQQGSDLPHNFSPEASVPSGSMSLPRQRCGLHGSTNASISRDGEPADT
jgi:hypothetical protein